MIKIFQGSLLRSLCVALFATALSVALLHESHEVSEISHSHQTCALCSLSVALNGMLELETVSHEIAPLAFEKFAEASIPGKIYSEIATWSSRAPPQIYS